MPRYRIRSPIERATGEQIYEVEADSPEAARVLWYSGNCGECVSEEIEIEKMGEPEIEEIEE